MRFIQVKLREIDDDVPEDQQRVTVFQIVMSKDLQKDVAYQPIALRHMMLRECEKAVDAWIADIEKRNENGAV